MKDNTGSRFYKLIIRLMIVFIGLATLLAFDQVKNEKIEPPQDLIPPLVQKELDRKLKTYKKNILDKCYKTAMEAAELYIDSLVAEEIKIQASDTLRFPAKPVRPDLRESIILNDSTEIVPIIKD